MFSFQADLIIQGSVADNVVGIPEVWVPTRTLHLVAASITQERVREHIVRLCRSSLPSRQLRAAVLDQLRRAVGFDSYAFVLTDPLTCVGGDPLADMPLLDELPRLIRLKYATTVNRWTSLGEPPVALTRARAGGASKACRLPDSTLRPAYSTTISSQIARTVEMS